MRTFNFGGGGGGGGGVGGGACEINNDFSVFIGVANAFAFELIVFIAILVVWYGVERVSMSADAERPGYTNHTMSMTPAVPHYVTALAS